MTAIACSVLAHAGLLAVHFAAPGAFRLKPSNADLEVILVNAKHDRAPVKADAVAQANLDGGGNAETGRAESPLPDLHRIENGDSIKALQRRISEAEEMQRNVLAQTVRANGTTSPVSQRDAPTPSPDGTDNLDTTRVIARMTAEITQRISDQNRRPRKTYISPTTQEAGYAMYYKGMQKRVEEVGTLDFPKEDGRKLYGEVTVSIPIYQDGTIYEKEGGPRVERSSGNAALDRAALAIARRAAPFGRFPSNMRSPDRDDQWVVITTFIFSHDERLRTDVHVLEPNSP